MYVYVFARTRMAGNSIFQGVSPNCCLPPVSLKYAIKAGSRSKLVAHTINGGFLGYCFYFQLPSSEPGSVG
jgi:hypothetical protein